MKNFKSTKDGNHYARQFKLHHCIGNKKFDEQVKRIQREAVEDFKVELVKRNRLTFS